MADTQRSQAALLNTLFADGQSAGSITPQDMRDLIVSLLSPGGAMYITTPAATTIGVSGTYVKAAGATNVPTQESLDNFTHIASNRLRYDGVADIHAFVSGSFAITSAGANKEVGVKLAKNGTVIDETIITRTLGSIGDKAALSIHAGVNLSTNDYVELFVTNLDDTSSVTVSSMYIHIDGGIV